MKQLLCLFVIFGTLSVFGVSQEVKAVTEFDPSRYLGTWYEVARTFTPFQADCVGQSIAKYSKLGRNLIRVQNSCPKADGSEQGGRAVAWTPDSSKPAELKVSFVPFARIFRWFGADYWVLYIDDDYTLALVGNPARDSAFFLARQRSIPQSSLQLLLDTANANGYQLSLDDLIINN